MEITLVAITFMLLISTIGVAVWFLRKEIRSSKQEGQEFALSMVKQDMDAMRKEMGEGLRFSTKEIQTTLERTQSAYANMMKELGMVQEIGRDMKNLQEFFKSPKHRGNIGEQLLEEYLVQILPRQSFQRQYSFKEGTIVDAVIKTNQGMIPIDAKFTSESFTRLMEAEEDQKEPFRKEFARSTKKHIDDISRKYILPQEGTVDFAIMYIPSEPVYYEILTNLPELSDYATQKRVYLISPKTLYYFLKTILMALQGAKIEEASKNILRGFREIQQEAGKVEEEMNVLTTHIDHAKTASQRTQTRFDKLTGKIERLNELEPPETPPQVKEPID